MARIFPFLLAGVCSLVACADGGGSAGGGAGDGGDGAGGDGGSCPAPLEVCGEACVDVRVDPAHCGACGRACGEGEACLASTCEALRCDEALTACGHACVDLRADPTHCGACGASCVGLQLCRDGACVCPEGTVACGDACVELATDPANCGACGAACGEGDRCLHGACTPAACEGTPLLPGSPETSVGGYLHALAPADWDGDGVLDVVVADNDPPEMRVYPGRGDGTFGEPFTLAGVPPGNFSVGDLDGDGDRDVVVNHYPAQDGVTVALQEDDGSFAITVYPWTGYWIFVMPIVDLDGDGLPEVVALAPWELRILHNEGGGTFAFAETSYPVDRSTRMRTGDLDGDGDVDLVALEDFAVIVFRNDGGLAFSGTRLVLGSYTGHLAVGDLDGDGDLDLATTEGELLRNRGDATFEPWTTLPIDGTRVEAADVDGDGRVDLVFTDVEYRLSVFLGTRDGFAAAKTSPLGYLDYGIFPADLDGDGVVDLLSYSEYFGTVAVVRGPGDGTFPTHVRVASDAGVGPTLAGAFFAPDDGVLDLVLATRSDDKLHVARVTNGGIALGAGLMFLGHPADDVVVGDIDGNGGVDVIATDRAGDSLTVVPNPPDGWLDRLRIPAGDGPIRVALADVDGDGWQDLAVLDADGRELRVLRNHAWADPVIAGLLDEPRDLATGDADGDGAPDFAVAVAGWVQLVRSDGHGRLPSQSAVAVDAAQVAFADLDVDGRDEVLALGPEGLHVLRSVGTGLEPAAALELVDARAMVPVDLDRDGWPDVLVVDRAGRVEFLRGGPGGALVPSGRWAITGAGCEAVGDCAIAVADSDGDGRVEVFVATGEELDWVVPGCDASPP